MTTELADPVFSPLTLPCGLTLKNRLVKAAMEENLATADNLPSDTLIKLYKRWGEGGTGVLITGNVMVDRRAMTGPGGVALEVDTPLELFKTWAREAQRHGAQCWMQINHPGRQVFAAMNGIAVGPSDVAVDLGKRSNLIAKPIALDESGIRDVISRFAHTAKRAEEAGFSGVEIHAAHGYLISQFLSPISNKRDDQWGGSIENRARLLLEVVKAVRAAVSSKMAVAVKLNSADFQRGGFSEEDARYVIEQLNQYPIDVVELSGGSYESPAMQGVTADGRTLAREAYFLEFAKDLSRVANMPLMTTGGIKRKAIADQVLKSDVDLVGMATALAFDPSLPERWQSDESATITVPEPRFKDKTIAALATMAIVRRQLRRIGSNKPAGAKLSPLASLILDRIRFARMTKRYNARIAKIL